LNLKNYDSSQVDLLKEECITVDDCDVIQGRASKMDCHLKSEGPPLHRAFSVFLFNRNNELLMQRRADSKILFPRHFTNTCCSHPLFTEAETVEENQLGVKLAARRKLFQELGIPGHQIPIEEMKFVTRIRYRADSCERWAENEIDYILFIKCQEKVTVDYNANEVESFIWVGLDDLDKFAQEWPLSPWFKKMLESGKLRHWWSNLDKLDSVAQPDVIHNL